MNPHWATRLLVRGDGRWYAVRKLVRNKRIDGALPFGPAKAPPSYQHIIDAEQSVSPLDELTRSWYRLAREEFSDILGTKVPFRDPTFRFGPAVGQKAQPWIGETKVSVMWRSLARTAEDISRAVAIGVHLLLPTQKKVLTEQLTNISRSTRSLCNSQRTDIQGAVDRWASSLRAAVATSALCWIKSLQTLAEICAKKAESIVQRMRANEWRVKVGARPAYLGGAAIPTKVAVRWAKGAAGWVQPPIGEIADNDGTPIVQDDRGGDRRWRNGAGRGAVTQRALKECHYPTGRSGCSGKAGGPMGCTVEGK